VGAWRVRANYSSPFENAGQTVSALSELFYIEGTDYTKFCDGLGTSNSPGRSGSTGRFKRGEVINILLTLLFFMLFN